MDGKGYCRKSQKELREKYLIFRKVHIAAYDNTCHTKNKAYCYEKYSEIQKANSIFDKEAAKTSIENNQITCSDSGNGSFFLSVSVGAILAFFVLLF